ncbi:MAG TPA: NAD(P)H-dependent oxidoreductase [Chthoniobacteraceae bacterium]|jgi:nitroreductase|nr:NAD(P)H-dependent oxidoreductase [Chthoniobacteraceae bacterium]
MNTKPVSNETLLQQLQWRYATKAFDPWKKISDTDWETLEKTLILTPTSYGLQPMQFVVITDQAMQEALVPHSWNQRQPADCSHFVVFAARTKNTEVDIDRYLSRIAEVRGGAVEALGGLKKMLMGDVVDGPRGHAALEWATRQAYIALGNFMTAAALLGIDTCPMEGFVPEKYDEILGLPAKGYHAAVACAAGYRAEGDKYATVPKVRFSAAELIVHV